MYARKIRSPRTEAGAATVLVAIVLLIAATLIALTSARTSINEQRLSASDVRARQAHAAAQAGLEHALAIRSTAGLNVAAEMTSLATIGDTLGLPRYRVRYCLPNAQPAPCPATPAQSLDCGGPTPTSNVGNLLVFSCGWSDDAAARRPVTQISARLDAFGSGVGMPLVAQGTANLLVGGASILNYFNDLTVWSGDSFLGQSMTGKTFIRDTTNSSHITPDPDFDFRNTGNSPACNNPPTGYICSTQGSDVGHDVIVSDSNLSSLSGDAFFSAFMGATPTDYRENVASIDIAGSDVASLDNVTGHAIWIDGDVSLSGTYGTQSEPVVIVVNGNLSLGSNAVINGIVYVVGNLTGNGTPKIFGSLLVAGTANATGNLNLIYDPTAIGNTGGIGAAVGMSGTWKDWLQQN